MKNCELVIKEVSRGRLTITPTRITVKIPCSYNSQDSLYSKIVLAASSFDCEGKSFRGRFKENSNFVVLLDNIYKIEKLLTL